MIKKVSALMIALIMTAGTLTVYAEEGTEQDIGKLKDTKVISERLKAFIKENDLPARVVPSEERDDVTQDTRVIYQIDPYVNYSSVKMLADFRQKNDISPDSLSCDGYDITPTESKIKAIDGFSIVKSSGGYGSSRFTEEDSKTESIEKFTGKDDIIVNCSCGADYYLSCKTVSICRLNNEEYLDRLREWYRNFKLTDELRETNDVGITRDIAIFPFAQIYFRDDNGELVHINTEYLDCENGDGRSVWFSFDNRADGYKYAKYCYSICGEDCPLWDIFMASYRYINELEEAVDWDFTTGDTNGDGTVNVSDISLLAAHIKGIKPISDEDILRADIRYDKRINVTDINKLAWQIKGVSTDYITDSGLICEMYDSFIEKHRLSAETSCTAYANIYYDDSDTETLELLTDLAYRKNIDTDKIKFIAREKMTKFRTIMSYADDTLVDTDTEEWLKENGDRYGVYFAYSRPISPKYHVSGSLCKLEDKTAAKRLRKWYSSFTAPEDISSKLLSSQAPGDATKKMYLFDDKGELVKIDIKSNVEFEGLGDLDAVRIGDAMYDITKTEDGREILNISDELVSYLEMLDKDTV